ncbi:MAG: hypothetical protein RL497_1563 [Pseudomonadota bacterium]|jgi:uncharacterized protein (TIGR02444 family)
MNREKLVDFACRIYACSGVERHCRLLQDESFANINLVLWLTWLQDQAIYLEKEALFEAEDLIGEISGEVVALLRHVRQRIKHIGHFTRVQEQLIGKHILQAELSVEKILLERLQDLTGRLPRIQDPACEPLLLRDYLSHLQVPSPAAQEIKFFDILDRELVLVPAD